MKSLLELYREHQGKVSDKWSLYLSEYDRLFSIYRHKPVRILEIGIQNGGSLEIWSKYFLQANTLIGCDINVDCAKLTYDDSRIKVVIGNANNDATETKILTHSPSFDLIIDDGSHTSSDIVKSFARYFCRLNQGGLYITEDLHCSYWNDFEGGLYSPYSSMAFFKKIADVINHEHWGIENERKQILQVFSEHFSIEFDEFNLEQIHSVEFINSICVVHKCLPQLNVLGTRFIAGHSELLDSGLHGLSGSLLQPNCQIGNPWTAMITAPDMNCELPSKAISILDKHIIHLNQTVADHLLQIEKLNQVVNDKEVHIINVDRLLTDRDTQINKLNQIISEIQKSTIWKLTIPLRFFGLQLLRFNTVYKALPYALAMCGGYRGLIGRAWRTYQNEGINGIKRRIIFSASPRALPPDIVHAQSDNKEIHCNRNDYDEWVRLYDTLTVKGQEKIIAQINGLHKLPLISVVMPVYNPPLEMLEDAIRSVQDQLYENWELCIADDASTNTNIQKLLQRYADSDSRIKVVFRKINGHISVASNSAIELANGEFIALLDHDDILPKHALYWVADAIASHPDVGIIYSDEDKIDQSGQRYGPYFKPDWNPDLFLSHNMISHLGVYRTELVKNLGGFRQGFEGSQDYDLALRCTEQLSPNQIVHIPRVLYHWRSHPGSAAQSGGEKKYAFQAGENSLNHHFSRVGIKAKAELLDYGMYRVRYDIPTLFPMVSLIIPTQNRLELIKKCIESIINKTNYNNYEIIIVDNKSDDPEILKYFIKIANDARIRVIRDECTFNYSSLNNTAVQHARGEYIGLVNNDIEVITPDWLIEMIGLAIQPGVGAVGARLWYPNDTLQHGGIIIGIGGVAGYSHKNLPRGHFGYCGRAQLIQTLAAVTAACLVIKKDVYLEVGGLDEVNLKIAFNDVDFCLRVREAGYRNVWTPYAELYHHESATHGSEDTREKRLRFTDEVLYMKKRWSSLLMNDPAYNPNLTLDREDFSLAWPPRVVI